MYQSPYFAPPYFAPSYFATTAMAAAPAPAPAPAAGYRDRDAYEAILSSLRGSGEFAEVVFGVPIGQAAVGADRSPMAVLLPNEWAESADIESATVIRRVGFTLTLSARDEDPAERFRRLDRLTSVVQNAIDGSDLGGGCLRSLSGVGRARYDPGSPAPEQRVVLDGQFSYLIDPAAGHDVSA